jgi:hypothetical protein
LRRPPGVGDRTGSRTVGKSWSFSRNILRFSSDEPVRCPGPIVARGTGFGR